MSSIVIFGGTTEGRLIGEFCANSSIPVRYCTASEQGTQQLSGFSKIQMHVGRMSANEMILFFQTERPKLVIDATHPYALEVSRNIMDACNQESIECIRTKRDSGNTNGCKIFMNPADLLDWLKKETGNIFVTTGTSGAKDFTILPDFQTRVWLRILPAMESLRTCLDLGYHSNRLICMQGPFSEELNREMFRSTKAKFLIAKDSGSVGGLEEKIRAAEYLGMQTGILSRKEMVEGISLEKIYERVQDCFR